MSTLAQFLNVVMANNHIAAIYDNIDKLNGINYDIWQRDIEYFLNELGLVETLSNSMVAPKIEDGVTNAAGYQSNLLVYQNWMIKDHRARYIMLTRMHDDLIGEYENYPNAKEMW